MTAGGNIGHKLLSLMGWAGGGLGKDGAGIAEPVTATTVFGREGLGSRQVKQNFKQKIHKIVQVGHLSTSHVRFRSGFLTQNPNFSPDLRSTP